MIVDEVRSVDPDNRDLDGPVESLIRLYKYTKKGTFNFAERCKDGFFGFFKTKSDGMKYYKDAAKFSDDPEIREIIDKKNKVKN